MDSKNHYIKECLVSKPPTMNNLASHMRGSKTKVETRKMEEELPKWIVLLSSMP